MKVAGNLLHMSGEYHTHRVINTYLVEQHAKCSLSVLNTGPKHSGPILITSRSHEKRYQALLAIHYIPPERGSLGTRLIIQVYLRV